MLTFSDISKLTAVDESKAKCIAAYFLSDFIAKYHSFVQSHCTDFSPMKLCDKMQWMFQITYIYFEARHQSFELWISVFA